MRNLGPPSGLNPQTAAADLASEAITETTLGIAFGHSAPSQRLNTRAYLASKNGSKNGGSRMSSGGQNFAGFCRVWQDLAVLALTGGLAEGGGR